MNDITFSAILPNYNSSAFLAASIESLINQTEPFTEIIIIDDGSTDESLAIIQRFMREHKHIRLIQHEKNQGTVSALNHGIEEAIGDYIILCAADDCYGATILASAKRVLKEYPHVGIICGDAIVKRYDLSSSFLRTLPFSKNTFISADEFTALANHHHVGFNGAGGMLMNRQAVLTAGLLYPALRWHCDWLLYFVVAYLQGIYYLDTVFVYVNTRKEGYAEGKRNWKIQKEVLLKTVQIIHQDYPALWQHFKTAALLPHYGIRYIFLFLFHPLARRFLTVQLLWKFFINNAMVIRIGRMFPYRIILSMRKLLKA